MFTDLAKMHVGIHGDLGYVKRGELEAVIADGWDEEHAVCFAYSVGAWALGD